MSVTTPIYDFVQNYKSSSAARLHMPGHKGAAFLGCEASDITEITGADSLYEATGIIAESERNAAKLFRTKATFYSTEGSSLCIRSMLYLALLEYRRKYGNSVRPTIVAGRNAHKVLLFTAALLDFDIIWIADDNADFTLCSCRFPAEKLEAILKSLPHPPAGVYITSPDYLGNTVDIEALAAVSHKYTVPLLVDNAHGAYLKFLHKSCHPITLGADICCDSAHKTLPVLTGGAYLHVGGKAPEIFSTEAKKSMALFGSTSPSYLILQSLDLANSYIENGYAEKLEICKTKINELKNRLTSKGWKILDSDPLKLTIDAQGCGFSGRQLATILEQNGIMTEYSDPDFAVLMITPENMDSDFDRIFNALKNLEPGEPITQRCPSVLLPKTACSVREALLSISETIEAEKSLGRILAAPTVSCPPAVPIVVSGEIIDKDAINAFIYYGINEVCVVSE